MFEFMNDLVCAPAPSGEAPGPQYSAPPPTSAGGDLTAPGYQYNPMQAATIDLYGMSADFTNQVDSGGAGGAPAVPQGGQEGAGGTSGGASTVQAEPDPVQQIIDRHMSQHAGGRPEDQVHQALWGGNDWGRRSNPKLNGHGELDGVQQERRRTDPNNLNTDLAAADHYLFARDLADGVGGMVGKATGSSSLGAVAGMGIGALEFAAMPLYDGYKALAYGMKDHPVLSAMAAGALALNPAVALGVGLFGDKLGDGMLKLIANPGEVPSRPTMKSVGWGMKGALDGISDNWNRLWEPSESVPGGGGGAHGASGA